MRLRYLQPFRKEFSFRASEKLNEDSGLPPLMALLTKRVGGLSKPEAEKLLSEDLAALQEWLALPAQRNDPLHFVFGVALIASPADILRFIEEEAEKTTQPKLCLHMQLPPGAKLRHVSGGGDDGKLVTLNGVWMAISAEPAQGEASFGEAPRGCWHPDDYSLHHVRFGAVTGRKFVNNPGHWPNALKEIHYALLAPGGRVYATLSPLGKRADLRLWDETPFEACFHTLRVELEPPKIIPRP